MNQFEKKLMAGVSIDSYVHINLISQ